MKKGLILSLLLVSILLFVISCGPQPNAGDQPLDTAAAVLAASTGIQGVETNLLPNYPPNLLYDQNELIAIVEVNNKGNFNLEPQDCFVEITGFDPAIIGGNFRSPQSCAVNLGTLEGKNLYNVEGMSNQLEYMSSRVTLPSGVYEYEPRLNILTCYRYETRANPSVCIDPAFYQVTSEQKSCRPENVLMSNGQGGPVGVSYVGVNMVGSKAVFEINIKNFGPGRVLTTNSDIRSCGQDDLQYSDLDKVEYRVRTTSGNVNCRPSDGFVRLSNGQGKIICNYETRASSAFETPLQIELAYNYIDSFSKTIKIIETPE